MPAGTEWNMFHLQYTNCYSRCYSRLARHTLNGFPSLLSVCHLFCLSCVCLFRCVRNHVCLSVYQEGEPGLASSQELKNYDGVQIGSIKSWLEWHPNLRSWSAPFPGFPCTLQFVLLSRFSPLWNDNW
jgi:hypothetical protein